MTRIHLDYDLANADWPKRTPDTMEHLRRKAITESHFREHQPGGHDQDKHGRRGGSSSEKGKKDEAAALQDASDKMKRPPNSSGYASSVSHIAEKWKRERQTKTPEFKKWFGKSKIVDDDGAPLVMYHGTLTGGFEVFDLDRRGTRSMGKFDESRALHFSEMREIAEAYSELVGEYGPKKTQEYTVNGVTQTFTWGGKDPGSREIKEVFISAQNPMEWEGSITEDTIKSAKNKGHDAVIVRDTQTGKIYDLAVFNPTQIKSATGNRGTFDPDNPKITESHFREHLPGGHDQDKHGRRGGSSSEKGKGESKAGKQTETPEFKKWFGKSKVVDEDGEPLVVYHGTKAAFDEFDKNKSGQFDAGWFGEGFYFSRDPEAADDYTRDDESRQKRQSATGGNIMPVYLKINNPFVISFESDAGTDLLRKRGDMTAKEFGDTIQQMGHDGIIFYGPTAPSGLEDVQYVTFEPTQIKSATGNTGTFDPDNPKITESHFREHDDHDQKDHGNWARGIASKGSEKKTGDYALDDDVPVEPGTAPIPEGHIRFFHYSNIREDQPDNIDWETFVHNRAVSLRDNGIQMTGARGEQFGEPNQIWATRKAPESIEKIYVEFSLPHDDPRIGGTIGRRTGSIEEIQNATTDATFTGDIKPDEIVAVHEPWHKHARYMIKGGSLDRAGKGEFDHLLTRRSPDEINEFAASVRRAKMVYDERQITESRLVEHLPGEHEQKKHGNRSGKQTETPEFKKWFGKSKVVDEDGEPLVIFHGTPFDFDEIDPSKFNPDGLFGPGFYMTEDAEVAGMSDDLTKGYALKGAEAHLTREVTDADVAAFRARARQGFRRAGELEASEIDADTVEAIAKRVYQGLEYDRRWADIVIDRELVKPKGSNIKPLFASITDPLDMDAKWNDSTKARFLDAVDKSDFQYKDSIKSTIHMHDTVEVTETIPNTVTDVYESLLYELGTSKKHPKQQAQELIQLAGYDGLKHKGGQRVGDSTHRVWIAFSPGQIKSATGNRGSFDPDNPKITESNNRRV